MGDKILPYCLMGTVIKGFGRGSKELGVPTANISDDALVDLPKELNAGIYFGWVNLDGEIYKMVMSIGWNPFYKNEKRSMEVHILHEFSHDLYGKILRIMITGYIRAEEDFKSLDDLIKQIQNDITIARKQLDEPHMVNLKNNTFLSGLCSE